MMYLPVSYCVRITVEIILGCIKEHLEYRTILEKLSHIMLYYQRRRESSLLTILY